jgi:nitrilase
MSILLAAVQMTSSADLTVNIQQVELALQALKPAQHTLVVLPECWACFGGHEQQQLSIAERLDDGQIQQQLAKWAQQYQVYLVAGSIPIQAPGDKFYAACLIYDPTGQRIAQYNKIHLFDVQVADATGQYQESLTTEAGQNIVVLDLPFAKVGFAICYDIRFPEMFRVMQQQGCEIVCLPSAFTYVTGQAHWQTLIKSRAIENQCYMIAANQTGTHANNRQTWGHSMLVNGWGDILAEQESELGLVQSYVDLEELTQIRAKMPNQQHRRIQVQSDL